MEPAFYYYTLGGRYYYESLASMDVTDGLVSNGPEPEATRANIPEYIWGPTAYDQDIMGKFIHLRRDEGYNTHQALKKLHMGKTSAYNYNKKWLEDPSIVPGYRFKTHRGKKAAPLADDEKIFIVNFAKHQDPYFALSDLIVAFGSRFEDSAVGKATIQTFIKEKLTFRLTSKCLLTNELVQTVNLDDRIAYAQYLAQAGIDYLTNCAFIDECGLFRTDIHAVAKLPKKGPSGSSIPLEMFGCITVNGVYAISQQASLPPNLKPPRVKMIGNAKNPKTAFWGTSDHLSMFVKDIVKTMKGHNYTDVAIVMQDTEMYHNVDVVQAIRGAKYKPVYIPKNLGQSMPVRPLWDMIKDEVRVDALSPEDNLAVRIKEVVQGVTGTQCSTWISQSKSLLEQQN